MASFTWVFLRGLTRSSMHWGPFVEEFEQALSVRVITLDLPGNGSLWRQKSPLTVATMVRSCQQQLQERGIVQPVSVLAMSLGGMVAAHWALQQPQQLRELVLINTSMRPFNPAWQRLRPVALLSLLRLAAGRASAQSWEREIIRLTTRHARCDVLDAWCAERLLQPVSGSNALRQLLAAARYKAQRQGPELPTLVLSGAGDQLVSPLCSSALALHWRAAFQVHATAGHDLTLDDGPWVAEQVRRWHQSTEHAA